MARMIQVVLRTFWAVALGVFVICALYPVGTTLLRAAGVASFVLVWSGLLAFLWKRPCWRWLGPAITIVAVVFLLLPGRPASPEILREKYTNCLRRYDGVRYVWGGENALGIDCSGLVRRGLMEALFLEGIRTVNPGLVRDAISLWWNDTTARVLGEAVLMDFRPPGLRALGEKSPASLTEAITETPQINILDHALLQPGDLAVTDSGIHILAYLGDRTWIEADPGLERVVTAKAPSTDNPWLSTPVKIVRWKILQP